MVRQRIHVSASTMQNWLAIEDEVEAIAKERNWFLHNAFGIWCADLPLELVPEGIMDYLMTLEAADPDAVIVVDCDHQNRVGR